MDDELLPGVDGNQRSSAESGAGSTSVEACVLELCASVRDDATRAGRRHVRLHVAGLGDGLDEVPVKATRGALAVEDDGGVRKLGMEDGKVLDGLAWRCLCCADLVWQTWHCLCMHAGGVVVDGLSLEMPARETVHTGAGVHADAEELKHDAGKTQRRVSATSGVWSDEDLKKMGYEFLDESEEIAGFVDEVEECDAMFVEEDDSLPVDDGGVGLYVPDTFDDSMEDSMRPDDFSEETMSKVIMPITTGKTWGAVLPHCAVRGHHHEWHPLTHGIDSEKRTAKKHAWQRARKTHGKEKTRGNNPSRRTAKRRNTTKEALRCRGAHFAVRHGLVHGKAPFAVRHRTKHGKGAFAMRRFLCRVQKMIFF
jgi:hypothetical protein